MNYSELLHNHVPMTILEAVVNTVVSGAMAHAKKESRLSLESKMSVIAFLESFRQSLTMRINATMAEYQVVLAKYNDTGEIPNVDGIEERIDEHYEFLVSDLLGEIEKRAGK